MDLRAVIIFLCLLIAQTTCKPVNGPLNRTIPMLRDYVRDAFDTLNNSGLVPIEPYSPLNATELGGPEQPLTLPHLSYFGCLMRKVSHLTPGVVSEKLLSICQIIMDMGNLTNPPTAEQNCSLPHIEPNPYPYWYAKCLLQLLGQRLSKTKF